MTTHRRRTDTRPPAVVRHSLPGAPEAPGAGVTLRLSTARVADYLPLSSEAHFCIFTTSEPAAWMHALYFWTFALL
jgi:hypothetical protein